MKNTSFEISLDTNQTELPRGKRAKLNVYDDYADMFDKIEPIKYPKGAPQTYLGFNPSYIITKSHKEGDITVIDEFELTGVSIEQENGI